MLISIPENVSAAGNANEEVVGTYYFDGETLDEINIKNRAVAVNVGTMRVTDVLNDESGIYNADQKSAVLSTLAGKSFSVVENIPKIGTVAKAGNEIISIMSSLCADFDRVDYSKKAKIQTMYAYSKVAGEYRTNTRDLTHGNGYSPIKVAKAPHHKDHNALAELGKQAYASGRKYNESYRD